MDDDTRWCWLNCERSCRPSCMAYVDGGCLVLTGINYHNVRMASINEHMKRAESRQRIATADTKRAASIPLNPLPPIGKSK